MARTSDPHAATVKAWQTRARAAGGGTAVQQRGDFARGHSVPRNARAAAKAIADSLMAHGLVDDPERLIRVGMTRDQAEKNWHKGLEGRVHNANPERRAVIEAAHQENLDNPLFQEIVNTYEGGHGPVVFAKSEQGRDKLGERLGASTFIYDNPSLLAADEYALHSETPKPGAATASSHGGMAGALRHEFGHHAYDVIEFNAVHREAREEISQALARMKDVSKELTYYAGTSHVEAFAEALAIGTHPKYDPTKFGEAARNYIATVIKHARAGRGKTIRNG